LLFLDLACGRYGMLSDAMPLVRGVVALPGSKNTSRAKGMYRKLGDPASDQWHEYAVVRIGKVRSRSRSTL